MIANNFKINIVQNARSSKTGVALFSLVKNEIYFMPFFFAHYRKLGIETFLIYDDGSTDGTLEYLKSQADCTVVNSKYSYGQVIGISEKGIPKRFCSLVKETLPLHFFPNQWVITVDADEFMILPPGYNNIVDYINELEFNAIHQVSAPMVDFYPERLALRNHGQNISPFEASPFFDLGPIYNWELGRGEPSRLWKGIRARLIEEMNKNYPNVLPEIAGKKFTKHWAKLWKIPIIKNGSGIFRKGDHETNEPINTSKEVVLAHFKFYPGLDLKISNALSSGQYYNASEEYRFLDATIKYLNEYYLVAEVSRRFFDAKDLLEAGFFTN
jgi:hypothetical protein